MTTTPKSLMQRMVDLQAELPAVKKDMKNPYFKSKYADINSFIDVLRPLLVKHGLVVLQPLTHVNGRPAIMTIISCETGERIEGTFPIDDNTDPQKIGGWITYVRRYSLQSMFCMAAEDNDAEDVLRPTGGGNVFKPGSGATSVSTSSTKQWQKGGK